MRVAIVGCGQAAEKYHLPAFREIPGLKVTAAADTSAKASRRVGSLFGIDHLYATAEEMLEREEVDLLDIASPGFTHYELCLLGLKHGVNVLVEKPLVLSLSQAETLKERRDSSGLKLCVIQNYRYRDPFLRLAQLRQQGIIGRIQAVNITVRGGSLYYNPSWFRNEKLSGGILYELVVHAADLQTWMMGSHEKVVSAWSDFDETLGFTKGLVALVMFPGNRLATLDLRWFMSSPTFRVDILSNVADAVVKLNPDCIAITEGERTPYDEFRGEFRRMLTYGNSVLRGKVREAYRRPHARVIRAFVDSIISDKEPPVTIESVIPAIRLLENLRDSFSRLE